jgi:hypothetical protein
LCDSANGLWDVESRLGLWKKWDGSEKRRTMNDCRLIIHLLLALMIASCAAETGLESPASSSSAASTGFKSATKPLELEVARDSSADFLEGPGRLMTIAQCTGCHSGALVRQYRSSREGWQNLIRWMQKKQGLWPLDPSIENEILDYLSTRYGRSSDADDRRRPAIAEYLMPPIEVEWPNDEIRGEQS